MRVAKYDANPENPRGRETLRFRFSDSELAQMAQRYGNGEVANLRFKLEVQDNEARLVPTLLGGMAVTKSPSGKNFPWEVGFNHKSSPDIVNVQAIPTSEAEMKLSKAFLLIKLPYKIQEPKKVVTRPVTQSSPNLVTMADFSAELRSPADMDLLCQAVRTVNEVASRLSIPLDIVDGKLRAYVS